MRTDLIVVVPGITGSALADANGRELWGLGPGGLVRALGSLGGSIRSLELRDDPGDGPAYDGIVATELIGGLHVIPGLWSPVDGYRDLVRFLRGRRLGLAEEQLVLFPYDWRLSNRWTAVLLKRRVEQALARWRASAPERAGAKVVFICHSMGGLVARWYLDKLGGAEIARALVTLGTPHRGAAKSLVELVNGVRRGGLNLTGLGRSLPSSYELLPEYACIGSPLRKTTEVALPHLDADRVRRGMAFHDELDAVDAPSYPVIPIVGIHQTTWTSVRFDGERLVPLDTIDGAVEAGDGTVPRLSARPKRMSELDPSLRGITEGHGALAVHRSTIDQLDFVLTAEQVIRRGGLDELQLGLAVPDLHEAGEDVEVRVLTPEPRVLEAVAVNEAGSETAPVPVHFRAEEGVTVGTAAFGRLDAGGYTIAVREPDDQTFAVHATTLVW